MADETQAQKVAKPAGPSGATPRQRSKAKPKAAPAPQIAPNVLVQYQTTDKAFMLTIKQGKKFTFVKSDKPYPFDGSKLKHQMKLTIAAEIQAGRLKEVK